MPKKAKKRGRPPKAVKETNPQVQIGRHPQPEIDMIDAASRKAKAPNRSAWAWPILMEAAEQELGKSRK